MPHNSGPLESEALTFLSDIEELEAKIAPQSDAGFLEIFRPISN